MRAGKFPVNLRARPVTYIQRVKFPRLKTAKQNIFQTSLNLIPESETSNCQQIASSSQMSARSSIPGSSTQVTSLGGATVPPEPPHRALIHTNRKLQGYSSNN